MRCRFLQGQMPCLLSALGVRRLWFGVAAKSAIRVWSPEHDTIADVPSFALRTFMSSQCAVMAAVCRALSGELSLALSQLTNPACGRLPLFGHGTGGYFLKYRVIKMPILNPLPNRYHPLNSGVTDSAPMVIDTQANPQDILESAVQRIRACSDLLETLHCMCFRHGDVQDIPHITHALYLLAQDGNDLLQVAQQQMLDWKAPV